MTHKEITGYVVMSSRNNGQQHIINGHLEPDGRTFQFKDGRKAVEDFRKQLPPDFTDGTVTALFTFQENRMPYEYHIKQLYPEKEENQLSS